MLKKENDSEINAIFPISCSGEPDVFGFLCKAIKLGWFKNYPKNHFLIKAIEGRLENFIGLEQSISNDLNLYDTVSVDGTYNQKEFCQNFCMNFSTRMSCLEATFGEKAMKEFFTGQMAARNRDVYDEDTFFEALSEVSILSFYAGRKKWEHAEYEPPAEKGVRNSNPEAKFQGIVNCRIDGKPELGNELIANIEVKSPRFPHESNANSRVVLPTVLLSDLGRTNLKKFCAENRIAYLDPRAMKLKSLINDAAKKFNSPGKNEYNIVYINWSYRDFPSNSFLEAWSILTNEQNGLLNHRDIGLEFGLNEEVYDKVTAVIVYTESLEGLMFGDFRFVWQRNGCGPRFRMWVLDEDVREAELSDKSDALFKLTGMNPDKKGDILEMANGLSKDECEKVLEIIKENMY